MSGRASYQEYEESGVQWIGDVPTHWRVAPIRRFVDVVNGGTPSPDDANWGGGIPWATPVDLNACDGGYVGETSRTLTSDGLRSGSKSVPEGSVLLSTRAPIGYVAVTRDKVSFNQGCKGLIPVRGELSPRFLMYQLSAAKDELWALGQGTTFLELSGSALASVKLCVPPLLEQHGIVAHLDRETAEIDAFIADQKELITLLDERRAASITRAVTKGLDLTVPMKDSGSPWLGKVPDAWHVSRLTRYFDVVLGKMLDAGKEKHPDAELLPYIRAANIQDSGLELSDVNSMPFTAAESANLSIRSGDLLVVEGGSIGTSYLVPQNMDGWSFQKTVNRVRSKSVSLTSFLQYVLRSYRDAGILGMLCNGSTIAHLTAEKLLNLVIPMPSPQEQGDIVAYLDRETAEVDAAIADAKEAIELSKERRAALISAAVTGRIDVRNHITAELGAA